jgi:hypothetical protein
MTSSPQPPARPWEYLVSDSAFVTDVARELDHLGRRGWEAVGITSTPNGHYLVLLKRPRA